MKRRDFVKSMGLFGSSVLVPSMLGGVGLTSYANAASLGSRKMINARAAVLGEVAYSKPTVLPQVISIFLYGGPSELAGNLTNIADINANSQNPYNPNMMPDDNNTRYTKNGFWGRRADNQANGLSAGGDVMERLLEKDRMTVLRTLNRVKDDSKAHRPSIFSNLTGMIGEEDSRPGIATNLASVLYANGAIADNALFPFVTFEGDSIVFNQGDTSIPLGLKPISLNKDLRNPYDRRSNSALDSNSSNQDAVIEALAQTVMAAKQTRYQKVVDSFTKRGEIEGFINQLNNNLQNTALPADPDFVPSVDTPDAPLLEYPGGFGDRLKAAVNLVIHNPDTLFVSLGNNGLGGWDDHNSADDEYPGRMRNLMESLEVAAKHLEAAGKDNVIITVFGDFGRNVNLNNSLGWDHGNNQNLYMVGAGPGAGPGIEGNELGKIIGKTVRKGKTKENRQFTTPADGSYQCEPFAVASTIYKYFGIQNPELLTGEAPIDEIGTSNEWIDPNA